MNQRLKERLKWLIILAIGFLFSLANLRDHSKTTRIVLPKNEAIEKEHIDLVKREEPCLFDLASSVF